MLLATALGRESIILVDEPEAFLHPPQAKTLGRFLSMSQSKERQVIVATHSVDVLRGFLDGGDKQVRVVRLSRQGDVNHTCELSSEKTSQLWSDSLLRHSNVFDALFHEQVVVCEGDSDCRFYSAVFEVVCSQEAANPRPPDTMFVQSGTKDRLATVVSALRVAGVPVRVIADFDVLREVQPLRPIVESLGGEWQEVASLRKTIAECISSKKPDLTAGELQSKIDSQFDAQDLSKPLKPERVTRIRSALKQSTAWSNAKTSGKGFLPNGEPTQAFQTLTSRCPDLGLWWSQAVDATLARSQKTRRNRLR